MINNMSKLIFVVGMITCWSSLYSQTSTQPVVHHIPFGSKGNTVELTIENSSAMTISRLALSVSNIPSWLHVTSDQQVIQSIKGHAETQAKVTFSVDNTAPVNTEQVLLLVVTGSTGEQWKKETKIIIDAPERFELFQNYPNPFNPSTAVAFQLPRDAQATLKIYNVLGEEVSTLVNESLKAGYHEYNWDMSLHASGVYYYRLTAGEFSEMRKMVFIK